MCDKNELIECLHETIPFCTDIINLITDYAIPTKFQVNKIYVGQYRYNVKSIETFFFVSKINKKSIRNEGRTMVLMNRIPIEDFISFDMDNDRTNYKNKNSPLCFTLKYKKNNIPDRRYECTSDFLVYHDNKYLYFGYNFKNRFTIYKLKKDSMGQEYICNRQTIDEDKIYPTDTFDKSKYTFLNIPPHLKKYL